MGPHPAEDDGPFRCRKTGNVKKSDTWIRANELAGISFCRCGKPATLAHIEKLGALPEKVEVFCGDCSPVVFVKAYGSVQ